MDAVTPGAARPPRLHTARAIVRPAAPGEGARLLPAGDHATSQAQKGGGFRHARTLNALVGPGPLDELTAMRRRETALLAELEALRGEKSRLEQILDLMGIDHDDAR